jgi:sporulation protein YlmC with PRC-barrel domain
MMRLQLGAPVYGVEGEIGVLADLVVDPASRRVTHLVVQANHHAALARLVPIELATGEDLADGRLSLRCSTHELRRLPEVRELAYARLYDFPVEDPDWDVGITEVLALPGRGNPDVELNPTAEPPAMIYDRIPKGEVELRRGSPVVTADGRRVGRVTGLVADDDDHITAVVLRRGWLHRPRELTIPARAVARVETDAVTLRLAKRELDPSAR